MRLEAFEVHCGRELLVLTRNRHLLAHRRYGGRLESGLRSGNAGAPRSDGEQVGVDYV